MHHALPLPQTRCRAPGCLAKLVLATALAGPIPALAQPAPSAPTLTVSAVSPQGEVGEVRQVSVRFSAAAVAAGDPRAPAPFVLACNGSTPAGSSRWVGATQWLFELQQPLAAGSRCTLQPAPGFLPLAGPLQGSTTFSFSTGAPVVLQVWPEPGNSIEEDQHFVLRLNGAADADSLRRALWCEVDGLGERIPVLLAQGAQRDQALRALRPTLGLSAAERAAAAPTLVMLSCQRPLPAATRVRLVWGAGVVAAGQPALVGKRAQRWQWEVRERFTADFSCERENAQAACLPLRPLSLRFSAPVPRAQALAVRLVPLPANGATSAPSSATTPAAAAASAPLPKAEGDDSSDMVQSIRFAAPLPENTRFQVVLPAALRDDTGRALANASAFPLQVATTGMPALAKFAAAPFGIVEAGGSTPAAGNSSGKGGGKGDGVPPLLPLTLRQVQADVLGASSSGSVSFKRFGPDTPDATLMRWLGRLQEDHDEQMKTRATSLLAKEAGTERADLPQAPAAGAGSASAPAAALAARATEVIGVPLPQRGYHVVEVQSRILGQALLAQKAPMYARTGALVTNMAVHFKRGRSSSLVWVTSLDRGRPVAGARVAVNNCRGQVLWSGNTDAQGMARIERGFDDSDVDSSVATGAKATPCLARDGLFVSARSAAGDDLSFVFSRWHRGIEPWRFNVPSNSGTQPDLRAHTVFDRTLLRVGEQVSMKHFARIESARGLERLPAEALPTEALVTHLGSDAEYRVPLRWAADGRAASSAWRIPPNAALGVYDVALLRPAGKATPALRLSSGSLRVEAFRVPLVDARLGGPSGELVAPGELSFSAQLSAMAGGPMPGAPLQLSALLRPVSPQFAGYEEFSFEPPADLNGPPREEAEGSDSAGDGSTLVANKLAARTDAKGAASITVKPLPALKGPAELQAELSFADPSGETQTVSQRLRLWPAGVVVGLRVPQWAADRGAARFTAVVLSTDGKPMVGRAVQVQGRTVQTFSTRQRIVGGFYAYQNRREAKDLGVLCSGKTDAQGRLACDVKLDISGELELIASAKDDAGRSSQAAASAWVAGEDSWWFAQDNDDRIDLLPEKREVQPGDTARLQLRMPFRQATVLVTVEREGIIDARVLTLSGREPVIEVPIPAGPAAPGSAAWAPNVIVTALALRGRLREAPWWSVFTWGWKEPGEWWRAFRYEGREWRAPSGLVDLAKPSFKLGVAQLSVGLAAQRLDVKVSTPQPQYRVRETVKTTVQVSHGGQPMAHAQVAFAAVDEGLLALQPNRSWQLLEGLMQARPWGVETATAQGEVIGRRHYGRKTIAPGGGGGRNPTRELFDTLLLWRDTVTLDAKGQAVIEVPLNDSLTSFRLVAVADAGPEKDGGSERFGTGSASVRVTQDLQMLPGLAPLAREGDRFEAGFTLRNTTTRSMDVTASLNGQLSAQPGVTLASLTLALPAQKLTLASGAAAELRWPVQVPTGAAQVIWEAAVNEDGKAGGTDSSNAGAVLASDRVKLTQAVQPLVAQRVWQASLQALQAPLSLPTAAPEGALPGALLQVGLQSQLGGALPGLQRFFQTYPYTCLEQKTSRALALRDSKAWALVSEEITAYLDTDGLAHYYPPSPGAAPRGSDRLTAYLLSAAHQAGLAWPDAARERMLRGLTAFVEGRIERRFAAPRADLDMRKLAALEALARHGRAVPRQLGSIAWTPAAWPTSALLDAWSLLQRLNGAGAAERSARLDELQSLLRSRLLYAGTALKFTTEDSDQWWWLMEGPDANAARLLLLASDSAAWKDEVPALVTGALARQQRGAWSTTTANLWGVLALERFAARFEAQHVTGRTLLQSGGRDAGVDWPAAAARPAPPQASPMILPLGPNLNARHEGTGRPWLSVHTLAAVPVREPVNAGYGLRKTYTAVQRKQPDVWSRGDIVRVRLEVQARADMAWVVVDDPIPAGAALLGGGLGRDSAIATQGEASAGRGLLAFEERRADSWRGTFEWLPRGTQVIEYTMRLNTAGALGLPASRVEAMYAPEQFGLLPNAPWQVLP